MTQGEPNRTDKNKGRRSLMALAVAVLLLMGFMLFSAYIPAKATPTEKFIVKLKPGSYKKLVGLGYYIKPIGNGYYVIKTTKEEINKIEVSGMTLHIEKDVRFSLHSSSVPTNFTWWSYARVNNTANVSANGVKVCIIDTGIDINNPELRNVYRDGRIRGICTIDGCGKYDDVHGHGTAVATIIAGEPFKYNASGEGVGWNGIASGASLYIVKALDANGTGWASDLAEGINWCVQQDVDVISMSWGSDGNSSVIYNALKSAYDNGTILVASAGNDGDGNPATDDVDYPARYSFVLSVAATDYNNNVPTWSSDGSVDVAAPGEWVMSGHRQNVFDFFHGTSFACPYVAAEAALIKAKYGNVTPDEVYNIIKGNTTDIMTPGYDVYSGYGLIDIGKALS